MSRLDRISDRFPRFYKSWEKGSMISILIEALSKQLDEVDGGITDLMRAHWVDTAEGDELDKLGIIVRVSRMSGEESEHFRGRLKRAVDEYKGGGTVSVILESVNELLGAEDKNVAIVENPIVDAWEEFKVVANDTWSLGSKSIEDEQPSFCLTVEGEGEVSNPQITNMGTGKSVTFKGKLKTGEQLVITQNSASLNAEDVTANVTPNDLPQLLRKGSAWKYSEALLEKIGIFDSAKFDEHTFALGVPTVRVRFEWKRRQPATFEIQIRSEALLNSGLEEIYLEKALSSLKAAGVNATIKVME
jgi:hypothetical protein